MKKQIQTTILILILLTIIPFTNAFGDDLEIYSNFDESTTLDILENKITNSKYNLYAINDGLEKITGGISGKGIRSTVSDGKATYTRKDYDEILQLTTGFSFFIKTPNTLNDESILRLCLREDCADSEPHFSLVIDSNTNSLTLIRYTSTTTASRTVWTTPNNTITNNTWYHIGLKPSLTPIIYVNGVNANLTKLSSQSAGTDPTINYQDIILFNDYDFGNVQTLIGYNFGQTLYDNTTYFTSFSGILDDFSVIYFGNNATMFGEYIDYVYNDGDYNLYNTIFDITEQIASFPTLTELGLGDFKEYNISNYFNNYDTVNIDFLDVLNSESVSMTITKGDSDVTRFKSQYAIRLKDVNDDLIIQFYSYLTSPIEYDVTINVIGDNTESVETLFRITETPTEEPFSQISSIPDLAMGHYEVINRYMKNYFSGYDQIRISFEDDLSSQSVILQTSPTGTNKTFSYDHVKVELIPVNYFILGITEASDIVLKITTYNTSFVRNITVTAFDGTDTLSDNFTLTVNQELTSPTEELKPVAISSPVNRVYDCNEEEYIRFSDYFITGTYDDIRAIINYDGQTHVLTYPFFNNRNIGNGLNFQLIPLEFDLGEFNIDIGHGFLKVTTRDNAVSGINITLRAINDYGYTDSESFTVSSQQCSFSSTGGFNFTPTTKLMISLLVLLLFTMIGIIFGYFVDMLKIMTFVTVFVVVGFAIYFSVIGWLPAWILILMFIISASVVGLLIKNAIVGNSE